MKLDEFELKYEAKELEKRIREKVKKTVELYLNYRPQLKDTLKVAGGYNVYKAKPKGSSKIMPKLISLTLDEANIDKTQVALIDELSVQFPRHTISRSIWSKKLAPYDKEAIKKELRNKGLPQELLKGCDKLSQLRKMYKAYLSTQRNKSRTFKPQIIINKETVTINSKSYKVETKDKKPCIRVSVRGKRLFVRVDALATLLFDSAK